MSTSELQALVRSVELTNVRLVETAARARVRPEQIRPAQLIAQHNGNAVGDVDADGSFTVRAVLTLRVVAKESAADDEEFLAINVVSELTYRIPKELTVTREALNQFADVNGVYNVWPYWRELVQTTSVRMGFPPLLMPLFRVGRAETPSEGPQTQSRATSKKQATSRTPARAPTKKR